MSNLARAWAEKQRPEAGCQMHLLEVIAGLHNDDHGFCFPSNRYLAARLRKSEATIERGLKGLEDCKLIKRETARRGLGGGARRRISLEGYNPVAVQRELDERKALAKARRAAKSAAVPPGGCPQNEGKVPSECGQGTLILGGSESLVESQDDYSDPTGSAPPGGAEPGSDFRKDLFGRGARTVQRLTGRSMAKCKALIGSWLRIVDDEAATVLAAIDMAEEGELAEPTAWIGAQLHSAARRAGFSQGVGRRTTSNGALSLLADRMGVPEGAPEINQWLDNFLGPKSRAGTGRGEPIDVTPRSPMPSGRDHGMPNHRRSANGTIGAFLRQTDTQRPVQGSSGSTTSDSFAARNAAGLEQVRRGQWPSGCTHFVLADSDEGAAWEAYFAELGVKPRWMSLRTGLGAYLPAPWPPGVSVDA